MALPQQLQSLWQRRTLTFALGIGVMLVAGTLYNYSAYAPTMKHQANFSQTFVNIIIIAGDIGLYGGFTMGLLYDKIGFRTTGSVATVMIGLGYGISAMSLAGVLPTSPWLLAIAFFLVGQGSYGIEISALDVNIKNYSQENRGQVSGALLGGFGLSSGMYTLIYHYAFSESESVSHFIAFMAVSCFVLGLTGSLLMKLEPIKVAEPDPLTEETELLNDLKSAYSSRNHGNLKPKEVIKTLDFWLIWFCFLFGAGSGLMVVNNIGSIRLTFGGEEGEIFQSFLVGTFSVCNFLGRIIFGVLSDKFQNKLSRATWLLAATCIMAIFQGVFTGFPGEAMLPLLAGGTGLAYGGFFATIPTLVSLYFGVEHFGANFGMCFAAPAVGVLGFGSLAGHFYEDNIEEPHTKCFGEECYQATFAVSTSLLVVGGIIASLLLWRRRKEVGGPSVAAY